MKDAAAQKNILGFVSLNTCCLKLNRSKTFGLLWLEENALQCLSGIYSSLLPNSCYISMTTIKNKKPKANPEKFVTLKTTVLVQESNNGDEDLRKVKSMRVFIA